MRQLRPVTIKTYYPNDEVQTTLLDELVGDPVVEVSIDKRCDPTSLVAELRRLADLVERRAGLDDPWYQ